jgi:hypothetical protein
LAAVEQGAERFNRRYRNKAGSVVVLGLSFIWLLHPASFTLPYAGELANVGLLGDYNVAWRNSELLAWLKDHSVTGQFFTNARAPVYLHTGVYSEIMPWHGAWSVRYNAIDEIDWSPMREVVAASDAVYFIWFRNVTRYHCDIQAVNFCFDTGYTMEELASIFAVEPIIELEDGGVYRLRSRSA